MERNIHTIHNVARMSLNCCVSADMLSGSMSVPINTKNAFLQNSQVSQVKNGLFDIYHGINYYKYALNKIYFNICHWYKALV